MNYSIHYLSYRPRSVAEVVFALQKKKYEQAEIEETIALLLEKGFLNDESFTESWIHYRKTQSVRSRSFVRQELSAKGVPHSVIEKGLACYYSSQEEKEILGTLIKKQWQNLCGKLSISGCSLGEEIDDEANEEAMNKIYEKLLRKYVGKGFSPYLVREVLDEVKCLFYLDIESFG